MSIAKGLTLYSSDSRPRYATDILNVLALPVGSLYHFRYETKYLTTEIRNEFENQQPSGTRVLVAFRHESQHDGGSFIVPVRWATITNVELVLDFYIIRFRLDGYPVFLQTFGSTNEGIQASASQFLRDFNESARPLPVQVGLTPFVDLRPTADRATWIDVAKRLALHDTFATTHFLRIGCVMDGSGADVKVTTASEYLLSERQYAVIQIDYFAVQYGEHSAELQVSGDPPLMRIASGGRISLDSRYDSRKVRIQAGVVSGETSTEIEVSTRADNADLPQTVLRLPFRILRSKTLLTYRVATTAAGAGLIATPAILRDTIEPWAAVLLACIGALVLAIATNIAGSSR